MHITSLFMCLLALISICNGKEYYWTIKVQPGMRECFYETVKEGVEVEAEMQLLSGGSRDIDFEVRSPQGQLIHSEQQKDNSNHEFTTTVAGDYEFCLDNVRASWAEKLVFLDLGFNRDDYDAEEVPQEVLAPTDEAMSEQTSTMMTSLQRVGQQLDQVRNIQEYLRVRETRHRHTADNNLNRVFMWSFCECAAMLIIGSVQVFMLRKMFADTGRTTA